MNQRRDGGPAYPIPAVHDAEGLLCEPEKPGASLRDHYAGQLAANPWLMESLSAITSKNFPETTVAGAFKIVATLLFTQAQAMVDEKYRLDALDAEAAKA